MGFRVLHESSGVDRSCWGQEVRAMVVGGYVD